MKDDIEAAERVVLIFSWIGLLTAISLLVYTFLTFA